MPVCVWTKRRQCMDGLATAVLQHARSDSKLGGPVIDAMMPYHCMQLTPVGLWLTNHIVSVLLM